MRDKLPAPVIGAMLHAILSLRQLKIHWREEHPGVLFPGTLAMRKLKEQLRLKRAK